MTEEDSGRMRLTVEVEINPSLMNIIKDSMAQMPELVRQGAEVARSGMESMGQRRRRNQSQEET